MHVHCLLSAPVVLLELTEESGLGDDSLGWSSTEWQGSGDLVFGPGQLRHSHLGA